jgi:ABC-2 type transport system ATP-binding protein
LDEPTTGLDPNQIVEIRKLIREIGKEKTVILSTHILPEVEATCDRILIINNGKIVADGTSEILRKQAQGQEMLKIEITDAADKGEVIEALQSLETVAMVDPFEENDKAFIINSKLDMSSKRNIFNLCVEKKWLLSEMTPIETKLEDVFRELTTN